MNRSVYSHKVHVFMKEKGLHPKKGGKEWVRLSKSAQQKYEEKAKENEQKRKLLMKQYEQTAEYKEWDRKYKEWEKKIAQYYPPKPTKPNVWCSHFIEFYILLTLNIRCVCI